MKRSARQKTRALARRAREAAVADPKVLLSMGPVPSEEALRNLAAFFERPEVKAGISAAIDMARPVFEALARELFSPPACNRRADPVGAGVAAFREAAKKVVESPPEVSLIEPAPPYMNQPNPIKGAS